jgi:hypothetical protein
MNGNIIKRNKINNGKKFIISNANGGSVPAGQQLHL